MKKNFAEFINTENPDLLCLQEIKCQAETLPPELRSDKPFNGYHQYWSFAQKKGYSGTAVFSKKEALSVKEGIGIAEGDNEGRTLTVEFDDHYVVNCYFPNSQEECRRLDFKIAFCEKMLEHLEALKKKKHVLLCGDINVAHEEIDLAHPKANEQNPGFHIRERQWFSKLVSEQSGFADTFRRQHPGLKEQYTWWTFRANARAHNVGWRIDYWVVDEPFMEKVKKSFILPDVTGSDHCPAGIVI